jgi:hypothetical protein
MKPFGRSIFISIKLNFKSILNSLKWTPILIFAAFISCVVQKESMVEVLKPAEMNFPANIRSVTLVDNTLPQPQNTGNVLVVKEFGYRNVKTTSSPIDSIKVDSLGFAVVFNTANTLLQNELLDTVIVWNQNTANTQKSWKSQVLSPLEIKSILDSTGTDAVFSLDIYAYENTFTKTTFPYDEYSFDITSSFNILWRFYDSSANLLASKVFIDTLYFEPNSYRYIQNSNIVLNAKEVIGDLAWEAGNYSALKMYPWWKKVSRVYFTNGSANLKLAARYYEKGDYENAYSLWNTDYEQLRKKSKARAAFNLALYFEINGDLTKAYDYLNKAKEIYTDSKMLSKQSPDYQLIISYISVLKTRIDEDEKVRKQLVE